jgi:hypothetical protein
MQYWFTGSSLFLAGSFIFAGVVGLIGIKTIVSRKFFYVLVALAIVLSALAWRTAAKQESESADQAQTNANLQSSLETIKRNNLNLEGEFKKQGQQLSEMDSISQTFRSALNKIASSAHVNNTGSIEQTVEAILKKLPRENGIATVRGNENTFSIGQSGGITAGTVNLQGMPERHLSDLDKQNIARVFKPLNSVFPVIQVKAVPDAEPQEYAHELISALKDAGVKTSDDAGIIFPANGNAVGLSIAVNDLTKIPPLAEQFAEALNAAGIHVVGGRAQMPADDFWFVVGSRAK